MESWVSNSYRLIKDSVKSPTLSSSSVHQNFTELNMVSEQLFWASAFFIGDKSFSWFSFSFENFSFHTISYSDLQFLRQLPISVPDSSSFIHLTFCGDESCFSFYFVTLSLNFLQQFSWEWVRWTILCFRRLRPPPVNVSIYAWIWLSFSREGSILSGYMMWHA